MLFASRFSWRHLHVSGRLENRHCSPPKLSEQSSSVCFWPTPALHYIPKVVIRAAGVGKSCRSARRERKGQELPLEMCLHARKAFEESCYRPDSFNDKRYFEMFRFVLCVMVVIFLSACSVQSRSWVANEIMEEIIYDDPKRMPNEQLSCDLGFECDGSN